MRAGTARRICFGLVMGLTLGAADVAPLEVPLFRQEKNGCGAASVAMVAHYWSKHGAHPAGTIPAPEEVYRQLYDKEKKGILLSDMKRYFEDRGFHAFSLRGQWSDLERNISKGRPIIVGLNRNKAERLHFAVLIGAGNDQVWLNDPTRKRPHVLKRAEFEKQWAAAERWMLIAAPR
jgi:predicted double-glycine peptidase